MRGTATQTLRSLRTGRVQSIRRLIAIDLNRIAGLASARVINLQMQTLPAKLLAAIAVFASFGVVQTAPVERAAEKVKVYVFAEGSPAVSTYVPAALADSVTDLKYSLRIIEVLHNYVVKKRDDANVFAQIVGREERDGEFHVHAHVTTRDGRSVDLTGTSAHQWKKATDDLARQIVAWAKATQSSVQKEVKTPSEHRLEPSEWTE